ncbi:uncharacterized protein LOC118433173 [Folsomia candida]|uniref:uncharacterized protein LOC118433173 n=1 Tax=Folsomia candida TaxID=158441 RepID=UPI00160553F7|nr:uncharacterized protein LOC118433173 [Folsomia candida]
MFLRVAVENFVPAENEVQVKVEEDDVGSLGDQFVDDEPDSYTQTSVYQTKDEDLLREEDDTAFCIIPCPDNKSPNSHEKSRTAKREILEESRSPPNTIMKQNKLQPDKPEASAPRFSPRIKNQTAPPTRVFSPKQITSNPMSNSESSEEDDDTKSTPDDDKDWAPKIDHVDSIDF